MRILVMLNPTNKHGTKSAYTAFRKFLLSDGYILFGPELYMRVVTDRKSAEKHIRRLETHDPGSGVIRVIRMTEKQYDNIWYLTGGHDRQEDVVGKNGHILI